MPKVNYFINKANYLKFQNGELTGDFLTAKNDFLQMLTGKFDISKIMKDIVFKENLELSTNYSKTFMLNINNASAELQSLLDNHPLFVIYLID